MALKYAYRTAEQRSRGEYKPVHVLVRGFRLVDFDDGKRPNPYAYRAWAATFMRATGSAASRWYCGRPRRPRFLSRFLDGGTRYRPPRLANRRP